MTEPLVSVVVISYNSAATIIETLDSVKNQNYSNIQLVVADDASSDNTVELVRDWMNQKWKRTSQLYYK